MAQPAAGHAANPSGREEVGDHRGSQEKECGAERSGLYTTYAEVHEGAVRVSSQQLAFETRMVTL